MTIDGVPALPAKADPTASMFRSFDEWFDGHVTPVARSRFYDQYRRWEDERLAIRSLAANRSPVRVALLGSSGAGKSSFLNAVLGQQVLPVGVMQPCTSFVTKVRFNAGSKYQVRVQFCTLEQWQADVRAYVDIAGTEDEADEHGDLVERRAIRESLRKRIEGVLGELSDPVEALTRSLPDHAMDHLAGSTLLVKSFGEGPEMQEYLRRLVRGDGGVWPLIDEVAVEGPYEVLANGLELVDLPGLNDPNEARIEVTRKYIGSTPALWIVFNMVRGLGADVRRLLAENHVLENAVLGGTYEGLALVGTKADDIDVDAAPDLGLSEEASRSQVIAAYRKRTIDQVRAQWLEMVRELTDGAESPATIERLLTLARDVQAHAVSSSAYLKLAKIAPLRRDFGLDDEEETGIPEVRRHLEQLGAQLGSAHSQRVAFERLSSLRDEISFFFTSRSGERLPGAELVLDRLQREQGEFDQTIQAKRRRAKDRLTELRNEFTRWLAPLFEESVVQVERATIAWNSLSWATIRAAIHRDGQFRSPTTSRTVNFNRDIADPMLSQLPVRWEQYFADDLGRVIRDLVAELTSSTDRLADRIRTALEIGLRSQPSISEKQISWLQHKISLLGEKATDELEQLVRGRRQELSGGIEALVRERMRPTYELARGEKGTGMKKRILAHLQPAARTLAQPVYESLQVNLIEGLQELEVLIAGKFDQLVIEAAEQAERLLANANIDVDQTRDPAVARLLAAVPGLSEET